MFLLRLSFVFFSLGLLGFSIQAKAFEQLTWESQELAPGLVWKKVQTTLFDSPQSINVLEIDLKLREVSLVQNSESNQTTSSMAKAEEALAAVNAGFFDVKNGGSVTYLKIDGKLGQLDTTKWKTNQNLNAVFIIKKNGRFEIEGIQDYHKYTENKKYDDVLVTGSLLMDEGVSIDLANNAFVDNRHPRTGLGIVNKNKVVLVTVDGRNEQAAGMSLYEFRQLLELLSCEEAINLDGGGSTTMWISSEATGVVNRPSDNRKFDHLGERKVSNILTVK